MLYNGKQIVLEQHEISITRRNGDELRFKVSAIGVGVKKDFDAIYPKPSVPKIITEGKNGRQEREDWNDPKFQAELDERANLQNVYILFRCLERDENVKFDNIPTDIHSLRKLYDELKQTGLSEGDVLVILKEAVKASNLTQEDIEKAKANF